MRSAAAASMIGACMLRKKSLSHAPFLLETHLLRPPQHPSAGLCSAMAVTQTPESREDHQMQEHPVQNAEAARLYDEAYDAIRLEDLSIAKQKLWAAHETDPQDAHVLEALIELLADDGPPEGPEGAITAIKKAIELQPDEGFEKYMYLSQFLSGDEALQAARKGLDVLQRQLDDMPAQAVEDKELLTEAKASALVQVAELLLNSDDLEAVAGDVERLLQQAKEADPANFEYLQVRASLLCEQGNYEDALKALRESMQPWLPLLDRLAGKDSDSDEEDEEELPAYEYRFETAKLLLEVDDTVDTTLKVIESLLDETDQDPHTHYLYAMALHGGSQHELAKEALGQAVDLFRASSSLDPEAVVNSERLRTSIDEALNAPRPVEGEEE